jgi:prevent-host-death family protein
MTKVNIYEAKTHLSSLLARVADGEEIIIAKAGRPIARLLPYDAPDRERRVFGRDRGLFEVPSDFDAPLPADVLEQFEA